MTAGNSNAKRMDFLRISPRSLLQELALFSDLFGDVADFIDSLDVT